MPGPPVPDSWAGPRRYLCPHLEDSPGQAHGAKGPHSQVLGTRDTRGRWQAPRSARPGEGQGTGAGDGHGTGGKSGGEQVHERSDTGGRREAGSRAEGPSGQAGIYWRRWNPRRSSQGGESLLEGARVHVHRTAEAVAGPCIPPVRYVAVDTANPPNRQQEGEQRR